MAKIEGEGVPLRPLAFAVCGILVTIVGLALWDGITTDRNHADRLKELETTQATVLAEINRRLGVIENDLRAR